MPFIVCLSHRAREKVKAWIGYRQCYYSMHRAADSRGIYLVSNDEVSALRALPRPIKGWRVLRPPYDDIHKCVSFHDKYLPKEPGL